MSDLVSRLSTGRHPVSVARYKSADELEQAVAQGFVLVKFTDTRGGTELGFKIDKEKSSIDAQSGSGKLQLVGPLTLDYVRVECEVDLDIGTLAGTGVLRPADGATDAAKAPQAKASAAAKPRKSAAESERTSAQASGQESGQASDPSTSDTEAAPPKKAGKAGTGKAGRTKM